MNWGLALVVCTFYSICQACASDSDSSQFEDLQKCMFETGEDVLCDEKLHELSKNPPNGKNKPESAGPMSCPYCNFIRQGPSTYSASYFPKMEDWERIYSQRPQSACPFCKNLGREKENTRICYKPYILPPPGSVSPGDFSSPFSNFFLGNNGREQSQTFPTTEQWNAMFSDGYSTDCPYFTGLRGFPSEGDSSEIRHTIPLPFTEQILCNYNCPYCQYVCQNNGSAPSCQQGSDWTNEKYTTCNPSCPYCQQFCGNSPPPYTGCSLPCFSLPAPVQLRQELPYSQEFQPMPQPQLIQRMTLPSQVQFPTQPQFPYRQPQVIPRQQQFAPQQPPLTQTLQYPQQPQLSTQGSQQLQYPYDPQPQFPQNLQQQQYTPPQRQPRQSPFIPDAEGPLFQAVPHKKQEQDYQKPNSEQPREQQHAQDLYEPIQLTQEEQSENPKKPPEPLNQQELQDTQSPQNRQDAQEPLEDSELLEEKTQTEQPPQPQETGDKLNQTDTVDLILLQPEPEVNEIPDSPDRPVRSTPDEDSSDKDDDSGEDRCGTKICCKRKVCYRKCKCKTRKCKKPGCGSESCEFPAPFCPMCQPSKWCNIRCCPGKCSECFCSRNCSQQRCCCGKCNRTCVPRCYAYSPVLSYSCTGGPCSQSYYPSCCKKASCYPYVSNPPAIPSGGPSSGVEKFLGGYTPPKIFGPAFPPLRSPSMASLITRFNEQQILPGPSCRSQSPPCTSYPGPTFDEDMVRPPLGASYPTPLNDRCRNRFRNNPRLNEGFSKCEHPALQGKIPHPFDSLSSAMKRFYPR